MLTDRELVMVEAARTDAAVAEPVIVLGTDRYTAAEVDALREAARAAHAAARAVIQARRTRDADLPAVGTFHA